MAIDPGDFMGDEMVVLVNCLGSFKSRTGLTFSSENVLSWSYRNRKKAQNHFVEPPPHQENSQNYFFSMPFCSGKPCPSI
jgi:heterodisulfide reductase subunit A-like polyferredoxin